MAKIMQKAQYGLFNQIVDDNGDIISAGNVDDILMTLGTTTKRLSTGEITYDVPSQSFVYPMTQEETAQFRAQVPLQTIVVIGDEAFPSEVDMIDVGSSIVPYAFGGTSDD